MEDKVTQETHDEWLKLPLNIRLWEYAQFITKGRYVVDDGNREALKQLCETFVAGKYGFLLHGPRGTGKTEIMKMLQKITYPSFHPKRLARVNCIDIVKEFSKKDGGLQVLDRYKKQDMIFDDFGMEGMGKHYGDKVNVMDQIIFSRYDLYVTQGIKTFFTTNLSPGELEPEEGEGKYDPRSIDRIQGMCVVIEIKGESRRHENQMSNIEYPEIFLPYGDPPKEGEFNPETYKYVPTTPRSLAGDLRERMNEIGGPKVMDETIAMSKAIPDYLKKPLTEKKQESSGGS